MDPWRCKLVGLLLSLQILEKGKAFLSYGIHRLLQSIILFENEALSPSKLLGRQWLILLSIILLFLNFFSNSKDSKFVLILSLALVVAEFLAILWFFTK